MCSELTVTKLVALPSFIIAVPSVRVFDVRCNTPDNVPALITAVPSVIVLDVRCNNPDIVPAFNVATLSVIVDAINTLEIEPSVELNVAVSTNTELVILPSNIDNTLSVKVPT